jgi:hypothetical protein
VISTTFCVSHTRLLTHLPFADSARNNSHDDTTPHHLVAKYYVIDHCSLFVYGYLHCDDDGCDYVHDGVHDDDDDDDDHVDNNLHYEYHDGVNHRHCIFSVPHHPPSFGLTSLPGKEY